MKKKKKNWQEAGQKCGFDSSRNKWTFLSSFFGWQTPNLITGLSGWWAPDHTTVDLWLSIFIVLEVQGEAPRNGVETENNKDKSSSCDIHVTCDDVHWFLKTVLELNWCCVICIPHAWSLIWRRICYLKRFRLIKDGHLPWNEGRKRRTVSMNLHGVCRFARPTSRWAPQAHRMMGKTQWRHCERSFGSNVLVLGKQSRPLSLAVPTSLKDVNKTCRYRTSSELENSVLEINHVTNVTIVLDETAAWDRVSRSPPCTILRFLW
jgi:hypothetical protein